MISPEDMKRLFELARIEPTREELERLPKDVVSILEYVQRLQSGDLAEASPTLSMAKRTDLRADEAHPGTAADVELVTSQFPSQENGYLKTNKVFEK